MSKSPAPSVSAIRAVLDHDRARTSWVVRAGLDPLGAPVVIKLARVVYVYPRDGAGRLTVCVTDWGHDGAQYPPAQYIGRAAGCGYNKAVAALAGATVGGIELFDHCAGPRAADGSYVGHTLADVAHRYGWEVLGG